MIRYRAFTRPSSAAIIRPDAPVQQNTTYTVGGSGQFAQPGDLSTYLQSRRILPGVTVTVSVANGTYNWTTPWLGHIDGSQIVVTNSGMNRFYFNGYSAATLSFSGNGTTGTLTFYGTHPYPVGSVITIAGVTLTSGSINGTQTVTAQTTTAVNTSTVSFASTATGTISGQGTVSCDFETYNSTWGFSSAGALDPATQATVFAALDPIFRSAYGVIFQCDGSVITTMVPLTNRHGGNWKGCPSYFVNTGICQFGVSTGQLDASPSGPGGVGFFDRSTFCNFTNAGLITSYGGTINVNNSVSAFNGDSGFRTDFGGAFVGVYPMAIGNTSYGYRNNHGGWAWFTGFYCRGNSTALLCTDTNMWWAHYCDIQYNGSGGVVEYGGQGKAFFGTIKNNRLQQLGIGTNGTIDGRGIDCASTALFGGVQPTFGIQAPEAGTINIASVSGVNAVITGSSSSGTADIYLAGSANVLTSGAALTTWGTARTFGSVALGADASGIITAPVTGRSAQNTVTLVAGALTIPSPCPLAMSVITGTGSGATVTSIDLTNMTVGSTISITASNAATEPITFTDLSNLSLSGPFLLGNVRDTLTIFRSASSNLATELSRSANFSDGLLTYAADATLSAGDTRKAISNVGAVGLVHLTLPPAAAGLRYTFTAAAAVGIQVIAAGSDKVWLDGVASAAGGHVQTTTAGSSITLQAYGTVNWFDAGHSGTWAVT